MRIIGFERTDAGIAHMMGEAFAEVVLGLAARHTDAMEVRLRAYAALIQHRRAEVMPPHKPGIHQHLHVVVKRGQADPETALLKQRAEGLNGEMSFAVVDSIHDGLPLRGKPQATQMEVLLQKVVSLLFCAVNNLFTH